VQFVLGQVVRQDENSQELVAHARELYRVYRELLTTILERGRLRMSLLSKCDPLRTLP